MRLNGDIQRDKVTCGGGIRRSGYVRMRMAPIKLAGFLKNLKCNIRNIVLCPLNTGWK